MAKGDRKYNQLTKGIRLNVTQQRSIRRQIDKGVQTPTLTVFGVRVNLEQLRTAQELVDRSQRDKQRRKTPDSPPRLRYNAAGVATTKEGVKITREQAAQFRAQARRINAYSARAQYRDTLYNVVETSKKNTPETTYYPTAARRAPLPYQRVDFSKYKSQEDFERAVAYQMELYNPATRTSARDMYLGDVQKENWRTALVNRVGKRAAKPVLDLLKKVDGITFRQLTGAGVLPTVGDVYYGVPEEIHAMLDNYKTILSEAVNAPKSAISSALSANKKIYNTELPEDIGL